MENKKRGQLALAPAERPPVPENKNISFNAELHAKLKKHDGGVVDFGVVCRKEVTDDFVEHLVDTLQSSDATFSDYEWHDSGTGVVAEDQTDSALGTPTGIARVEGTQEEGGAANIYQSVGEITYDGAYAITEHGLFNTETSTGEILMDRSVFAAINVVNLDKIEFTYKLTVNAGG